MNASNQNPVKPIVWELDVILATALETALNLVVRRDSGWHDKVKPLTGRIIELELTDISKPLFFLPTTAGILVQSQFQSKPLNNSENGVDVSIRGSVSGFFKMLEARRKGEKTIGGDVKFEGNVGVGQQFEILLASLSPEWEESLSHIVGDPVAKKISETAEALGIYLRKAFSTIGENASDYIQHEAQLSPAPIEVQNFSEDVSSLRSGLARLEAKVRRIQSSQTKPKHKK